MHTRLLHTLNATANCFSSIIKSIYSVLVVLLLDSTTARKDIEKVIKHFSYCATSKIEKVPIGVDSVVLFQAK